VGEGSRCGAVVSSPLPNRSSGEGPGVRAALAHAPPVLYSVQNQPLAEE
jgi:hypothetical protein